MLKLLGSTIEVSSKLASPAKLFCTLAYYYMAVQISTEKGLFQVNLARANSEILD